jgi:hypothetical protein
VPLAAGRAVAVPQSATQIDWAPVTIFTRGVEKIHYLPTKNKQHIYDTPLMPGTQTPLYWANSHPPPPNIKTLGYFNPQSSTTIPHLPPASNVFFFGPFANIYHSHLFNGSSDRSQQYKKRHPGSSWRS